MTTREAPFLKLCAVALAAAVAISVAACGSDSSSGSDEGGSESAGDDGGTADAGDGGESDGTDPGEDAGEESDGAVTDECGDGTCGKTEDCTSCAQDCGECAPTCGDGTCNGEETCESCAGDCGECPATCGDGTCNGEETCESCAEDCGACPSCGDGTCNGEETCETCAGDCGACPACGDGTCNGEETCGTCEDDCGACPPECGDGTCNGAETCETCAGDCGACPSCGDGTCNGDETCETCTGDCGACPGPDFTEGAVCMIAGETDQIVNCEIKVVRKAQAMMNATALQFKGQYDATKVELVNFFDEVCFPAPANCVEVPLVGPGAQPLSTGHGTYASPTSPADWAGDVNVIISHLGDPGAALADAYLGNNGAVVGDGTFTVARFKVKTTIAPADATPFTIPFKQAPNFLVVTGATIQELESEIDNGLILTGAPTN